MKPFVSHLKEKEFFSRYKIKREGSNILIKDMKTLETKVLGKRDVGIDVSNAYLTKTFEDKERAYFFIISKGSNKAIFFNIFYPEEGAGGYSIDISEYSLPFKVKEPYLIDGYKSSLLIVDTSKYFYMDKSGNTFTGSLDIKGAFRICLIKNIGIVFDEEKMYVFKEGKRAEILFSQLKHASFERAYIKNEFLIIEGKRIRLHISLKDEDNFGFYQENLEFEPFKD